jgi:hypothetical protein
MRDDIHPTIEGIKTVDRIFNKAYNHFMIEKLKNGASYKHICTGERINFIGMDGDDYVCKVTSGLNPEDFANTTGGYKKFSESELHTYFREEPKEEWVLIAKGDYKFSSLGKALLFRNRHMNNATAYEAVRIVRE